MNKDELAVQLFFDADETAATFVFALEDASITFQMNKTEGGYHDGSLLLANFQIMCKQALEDLRQDND